MCVCIIHTLCMTVCDAHRERQRERERGGRRESLPEREREDSTGSHTSRCFLQGGMKLAALCLSLPPSAPLCLFVTSATHTHAHKHTHAAHSTAQAVHSHLKVAVAAATAAWGSAGKKRHGSRVQRPETPEERIQGGRIGTRTEGEL
jgi:hypothetical protein